ncbi:MAG TPA: hypothetical protein VMV44_03310 [Rectinemataceae bacterium]|nr:hypothetical protein [Rectinemataceae bacterium]
MPPERLPSAATEAARVFCRIDEFLSRWQPLTPWGKDEKGFRAVCRDEASVVELLDLLEAWLAFDGRLRVAGRLAALDRLAFHLGRLPRLPEPLERGGAPLDAVELFAIRKFASNYQKLWALLDAEAREAFAFLLLPRGVEEVFAPLGGEGEDFRVADACDPRLPGLRSRLEAIDADLGVARRKREAQILEVAGVDFAGRDFVVSAEARLRDLPDGLLDIEPWDGTSHLLRPRPGRDELALGDERAALLAEERAIEAEILAAMSKTMAMEAAGLEACVRAVARLDGARSRALLAAVPGFTRPRFRCEGDESLTIVQGRLSPLEATCAASGMRYTALSVELSERAALIFGSNMGGKTVVLQTMLFLQILAQSGFYVPAESFEAPLFPFIHFVGEGASRKIKAEARRQIIAEARRQTITEARRERGVWLVGGAEEGGLSGFGREIRSLVEAMGSSSSGGLLAFDEFARTTSSGEAEALLSALLGALVDRPGLKAVFATHFRGVARVEGARRFRMRGLDREGFASGIGSDKASGGELPGTVGYEGALARLNSLMRYELMEDAGGEARSDALLVAGLLGLDPGIVGKAEALYAGAHPEAMPGGNTIEGHGRREGR